MVPGRSVFVVVEFDAVPREDGLVGPVRERHGHRDRVRTAPTPDRLLDMFELGVVGVLVAVEGSVQAERGLVAPYEVLEGDHVGGR